MQRTSNIFAKIRAALAAWLINAVKCNFNNGVSNKERLFTLWGLHEFGHFDTKLFRYKSTRCSQLLSGPTGAKIAISVSQ